MGRLNFESTMRSQRDMIKGWMTLCQVLLASYLMGQERDDRATITNFKGIQYYSNDSLFYTNFRFRMQNRLRYTDFADENRPSQWEARVRRLRLRMDGYIYTRKISYSVQLAFSRGDQDFDDTGVPNIVRDAVMFYNFDDDFYVSFGQNKLPGETTQRAI